MKKIIASGLVLMCGIFPLKAQIYTPGGIIQGTSSSNNVGIGTVAPSAKLNIEGGHGDSRFLLHANGNGNPDAYHADLSLWASEPGLTWSGVGIGNNIHNFKTSAGGLTLLNTARGGSYIRLLDNAMLFNVVSVSGVDKQSLSINDNGNVGIGTTVPTEKLEIYNSDTTPGTISLKSSRNDFSYVDVGRISAKQAQVEVSRIGMPRAGGTNTGYLTFWTKADNGTDLTEKVRISENGNVGIGTTNPTSLLTVAGNINAREVKVTVDAGADFVFEKEYHLPSLTSLDTYIKENKHLPEIASAKEMQANGINLSEMNIKLLQKVEEMTLYMIEMKKENDKQNEKIKALENKLKKEEDE